MVSRRRAAARRRWRAWCGAPPPAHPPSTSPGRPRPISCPTTKRCERPPVQVAPVASPRALRFEPRPRPARAASSRPARRDDRRDVVVPTQPCDIPAARHHVLGGTPAPSPPSGLGVDAESRRGSQMPRLRASSRARPRTPSAAPPHSRRTSPRESREGPAAPSSQYFRRRLGNPLPFASRLFALRRRRPARTARECFQAPRASVRGAASRPSPPVKPPHSVVATRPRARRTLRGTLRSPAARYLFATEAFREPSRPRHRARRHHAQRPSPNRPPR